MATSPSFNWPEPDNTDLVKNGALAIRTAVDAIDTSMTDLLGGTTGQVLSKTSNTDMDFTWVAPTTGDITGVTAGTGISGGGTSGDVTITNSMATAITTAGDLIKGTGSGTFDRLGIGSTGQVLTVSGGAPVWSTPASTTPTFVGVNATRTNTSTTVVANAAYQVPFPTEEFDTNAFHDNSTNNSRLTIPTGYAGKYILSGWMSNPLGSPGSYQLMRVYKNGSQYTTGGVREGEYTRINTGANAPFGFSQTITASVGDYFELYYQQNNSETVNMWFNFQLTYVGA